ncbi:zinc finger protein [Crotalus adamanteus]|uniref:Zinc finger protein n=1 Tax=Crotalus adamanteus TaxID=8729 RepID=A0AAW1BUA2_CROAD
MPIIPALSLPLRRSPLLALSGNPGTLSRIRQAAPFAKGRENRVFPHWVEEQKEQAELQSFAVEIRDREGRRNPSNPSQEVLFRRIPKENPSQDISGGKGQMKLSAFYDGDETVVEPPNQEGLVSYEEVAVYFSEEEWSQLDAHQKVLHWEVMLENQRNVASLCNNGEENNDSGEPFPVMVPGQEGKEDGETTVSGDVEAFMGQGNIERGLSSDSYTHHPCPPLSPQIRSSFLPLPGMLALRTESIRGRSQLQEGTEHAPGCSAGARHVLPDDLAKRGWGRILPFFPRCGGAGLLREAQRLPGSLAGTRMATRLPSSVSGGVQRDAALEASVETGQVFPRGARQGGGVRPKGGAVSPISWGSLCVLGGGESGQKSSCRLWVQVRGHVCEDRDGVLLPKLSPPTAKGLCRQTGGKRCRD